jgi:hypothetical protein
MSPVKRPSTVTGLRKAVATSAASPAAQDLEPLVPEPRQPPPRPEKPVRFTLDLDKDLHRTLKQFAVSAETDASVVMRVLLALLRDDQELADRVRQEIWQRP